MRAAVKRLWSEDGDLIDAKSLPPDPRRCCVGMYADIGPVGVDGGDTFSFDVCTPDGLAARLDGDSRPYWGRGTLILEAFSWEAVENALHQYVNSLSGDDWKQIAAKLNRFMRWEFEDYRPYSAE